MKTKALIFSAFAAALMISSCARPAIVGVNDANVKYFNAWLKKYYPDAKKTDPGIYILEDEPGSGSTIGSVEDYPFIYISYTCYDLLGNITETTDSTLCKQLGTFKQSSYYGPSVRSREQSSMTAGLEAMLSGMRIGGSRKAIIPGWLATSYRFDTEQGYINNTTGNDGIYEVKVVDVIADLPKWQIDSIERYMVRNLEKKDSLKYGFYYIQTKAPTDTAKIKSSESVSVNYTGRLLNGSVFDTTDKNLAKDSGIYNASSTYEARTVTMAEEYSDISMTIDSSSSSLIDGFSYCLSKMKKGEKGIALFISTLGYSSTAKDAIPAYSPLRFDIEILDD